jgi:hypothetical protein
MGYFGPAGLPQPITRRLHTEIVAGMNQPDIVALFDKLGLGIELSESPEAFWGSGKEAVGAVRGVG